MDSLRFFCRIIHPLLSSARPPLSSAHGGCGLPEPGRLLAGCPFNVAANAWPCIAFDGFPSQRAVKRKPQVLACTIGHGAEP